MIFLTQLLKRYHRLFITLATILILYILYSIYRFDIFLWFCENESNAPACTQVGLLAKDQGNSKLAKYYLNQSCELGYGLGCYRLGEIYRLEGDSSLEKTALEKACKLQFELACSQK